MTNSKDTFTFNGFEPANTTPVPDVLFDELLSQLSGSELKTLLYIIRRTRGFKKDSDAISLSQFQKGIVTKDGKQLDKGCGIDDRQTIINALASLEKKRCIVSEKVKTAKGDNATTVYRILFSQGVVGKANQGSREKSTTLVGNSNHRSGKKPTTLVGNSNPQETVLQETDTQQTDLQEERESPPNTLDTHTIVSSDTAHADSLQDEEVFTNDEPQGDTHAAASGHPHRVGEPAAPGVDGAGSPNQDRSLATPEVRPVLEAQEITEGDTYATRVPTLPRADHPASLERAAAGHPQSAGHRAARDANDLPVVHPVGRGTPGPQGSRDGKDTSPLTPAQSLPLPQDAQAALEAKWNAQAMVAKAEELRGRQFSENARPKEMNAAGKLFKRKADLTQEDFEKAWKLWDTQWWHDNNGLFSITDLAAVPKNKSEMRLVIALEKLERARPSLFSVPTKQSTFVPRQSKIEVPDDFIQSAYSYR